MRLTSKPAAMALGIAAALGAATYAQNHCQAKGPKSASAELVVGGTIEWIEKSDVSAQREGVIEQIELREGMTVGKDMVIGSLHSESAKLAYTKAALMAGNKGPSMKAAAQRDLAIAERARLKMILDRGKNFASQAEVAKAEAEVKVGDAAVQEAAENIKVAEADRDMAERVVEEHTIRAPFGGIVIKRLKHPGETVRANEAVIRMGKVDHLRFYGLVPIEDLTRVRKGMVVDIRPTIDEADLPIEQKRFRGKVVAIGTEVNSIGKTEVEIYAEVANNKDMELRPGLKADMTIYIDAPIPPAPADMLPQEPQVANSSR